MGTRKQAATPGRRRFEDDVVWVLTVRDAEPVGEEFRRILAWRRRGLVNERKWLAERRAILRLRIAADRQVRCRIFQRPECLESNQSGSFIHAEATAPTVEEAICTARRLYDVEYVQSLA